MAVRNAAPDLRATVPLRVGNPPTRATFARPWFGIVALGAILNLVGFNLDWVAQGNFSAAGTDLALVSSQVKALFSTDTGPTLLTYSLFLAPLAAVVALVLLAIAAVRPPAPNRARSWLLVGCGVVSLLFTLLGLLHLVQRGERNLFVGTISVGFWLMLAASALLVIGGYLSFARQRGSRVEYSVGAAWSLHRDNMLIFGVMLFFLALDFINAANPANTRNIALVCFFIIVASGLNVLVGFSGQLSLGHAAFFTIGSYVSGLLISRLQEAAIEDAASHNASTHGIFGTISPLFQNFWVAILLSIIISAFFGFILALPALRVKGPYLAMITIAFGLIVQETFNNWTDVTRGPSGFGQLNTIYPISPASRDPNAFGRLLPEPFTNDVTGHVQFAVLIILVMAVCLWIVKNLLRSRWGRALFALKGNEIGAASVGVNVLYSKTFAFVLSAVFAGVAGTLYAHYSGFITPENANLLGGDINSIAFLLAVILGGTGSLYGPVFGAAFVALLPRVLDGIRIGDSSLADWNLVIEAVILLIFLYIIPGGFAGATNDIARRLMRNVGGDQKRAYSPASADSGPVLPVQELADTEGPDREVDAGVTEVTVETHDASTENAGVAADGGTPQPGRRLAFHRNVGSHERILEVANVSRNFKGLRAVDGVNMSLERGDVHAIIGPNGAGKTTMLNVISGLYAPSDGTISLDGRRVDGLRPHQIAERGIARTFQNLQVFGDMSVLENVMVGFHLHTRESIADALFGLPKMWREDERIRALSLQLLDFVGLASRAEDKAKDLPYGYQRLLEIARALAVEPQILLLDEPAAGLNPKEVTDMVALIRRIKDEGVTVLLIEHHMDLVMAISEYITVLDYGKKIAEGTPGQIQRDKRVEEAYFGTQDAEDEEAAHVVNA